ncbi:MULTISPECIES: acyltransferase [Caulobacter]|uniref:Putative acyltransferase n=2 Tax=Pseudomonadota TaxID=1224 RepID=R0EQY4_CAUVI|nr:MULTISPECIES: acyltransferase [Caulobacter]ENZ83437.1 putative acyltransferase [Caulobacter vibrioides OR37]
MPPDAARSAKGHYVVLDGLRGVASVMVVVFHLFEAWSGGDPERQIINHGYMAVDFFFLLSGFVIAYAYDDRWRGMSAWAFYKRRLTRLQPMILVGGLLGAALLGFQHSSLFPKLASVTAWQVLGVLALGFLMIPMTPAAEIRGWQEIYPLNGPQWSLFYEYIANILYAVGLRKLSNRAMGVVVAGSGAALIWMLVAGPRGDVIGGWALDAEGVRVGLTRVMFPFFAGVLLMRLGGRIRLRGGFAIASLLLVAALAAPRFGVGDQRWINGLYEAACIIGLFPLIVAIGAGEQRADGPSVRVARFFGELSYPLYITHYPLIYIYTGWVVDGKPDAARGALVGAGVLAAAVTIAYASLKLYDEPVRRWLSTRLFGRARA